MATHYADNTRDTVRVMNNAVPVTDCKHRCVCCDSCVRNFPDRSLQSVEAHVPELDDDGALGKLMPVDLFKPHRKIDEFYCRLHEGKIDGLPQTNDDIGSAPGSAQQHGNTGLNDIIAQPSPCCNDNMDAIIKGLSQRQLASPKLSSHNTTSDSLEMRTKYPSDSGTSFHRSPTKPPLCRDHKELIKHFCNTCNLAICGTCVAFYHSDEDHNVNTVSATLKQQSEEGKKVMNKMDSEVFNCEESVRELTTLKQQIHISLTLQEANIDRNVELAVAKIKKEAIILRFILREKEQFRIEKINREISRLQELAAEIMTLKDAAHRTIRRIEQLDYLEMHDKLVDGMESKLGRDTTGPLSRNLVLGMNKCSLNIPFIVRVETTALVEVKQCNLDLVQEFGDHKGSCDITPTSNGALVVCDRHANQILVYKKSKNGLYKKHCASPLSSKNSSKGSYGVAEDGNGKLLVTRAKLIEMYTLSGKYTGVFTVNHKDSVDNMLTGAYAIKVTSTGDILVADRENSTISHLDSSGTMLRKVHTAIIPHRVVVLPHNHVAISDWKNGKVAVISLDSGEAVGIFSIPNAKGLCYHEDTDCILVGRYLKLTEDGTPLAGSGVVEQYCSTSGRLVACIADGLCCPQNITIVADGMLAVADYKTVKIYRIT